jgi:hypothetical protein
MVSIPDGQSRGLSLADSSLSEYWVAFLDSVKEKNEFLHPGALRRYQSELLNRGEFSVTSPHTGKRVTTRASAYGMPGQMAYCFRDRTNFWLLTPASKFKLGHPLTEAITEQGMRRHYLFAPTKPASAVNPEQLAQLRKTSARHEFRGDGTATLVIGHENFAHHLWNELPALEAWLARASDDAVAGLSVVPVAQPFGPLPDIFPRLAAASFQAPSGRKFEIPLLVRVGSTRVTTRIREVIREYCVRRRRSEAVQNVRTKVESGWPRIWMSVRQRSRTPDNQAEFLLAVVEAILSAYPGAMFVFDGFSFPVGFFDDPRTLPMRKTFKSRSREASEFIAMLCSQAACRLGSGASSRLCSISGVDLIDAIQVAEDCDYYVCHGGTLQHKIGWIYDKPGFIHVGPQGSAHFLKQAGQADGVLLPDVIPAELTVASGAPENVRGLEDIPRNANYRIVDVGKAAEAILGSLQARLQTPPPNAGRENLLR